MIEKHIYYLCTKLVVLLTIYLVQKRFGESKVLVRETSVLGT